MYWKKLWSFLLCVSFAFTQNTSLLTLLVIKGMGFFFFPLTEQFCDINSVPRIYLHSDALLREITSDPASSVRLSYFRYHGKW